MNLQLGRAFGIVMQTTPYIAYRAMVFGAMCGVFVIGLLVLVLIGWVFGGGAAVVLALIALGGLGFGWRLIREYVLYILQAGHIAVITEIVTNGRLPEGVSQTQWGKQQVSQYFKELSVLALVDQLVKGIIKGLNRVLFNVTRMLPIPGLQGAGKVAERVVDFSLTYIDEAIIAYTFKTKNPNVFDAAKTGIVLYCQSWKPLLTNAVALTLLSYVFVIATTIVFLVPLGGIALAMPAEWQVAKFAMFALAIFMGVATKWVLFDPIACTSTLLTFLEESDRQTPDPSWEARIEQASSRFGELKRKASERFQEMGTTGEAVAPAAEPTPSSPQSEPAAPAPRPPDTPPAD